MGEIFTTIIHVYDDDKRKLKAMAAERGYRKIADAVNYLLNK